MGLESNSTTPHGIAARLIPNPALVRLGGYFLEFNMKKPETMTVFINGDEVRINKSDFDASIHKTEKAKKQTKRKPKAD